MKIEFQKNEEKTQEAELIALGTCLGIFVGDTSYRIGLTSSQWALLADVAKRKAEGD